ncbi:hypothetical protein ISP15_08625 [Dyella jejuensis]|uniref:Uncharacterized protein n=1 Tax=Dyella jejuensis TaxID=1432009 RepID=A0ABW8JHU3_9GAMM
MQTPIKIKSIKNVTKKLISSKVTYDDGIVAICGLDKNGSEILRIEFDNAIYVRVTDESVRLKFFQDSGVTELDTIMIIEESDVFKWLRDEELHIRDLSQAKHFIISAGEEIVDIVSFSAPKITEF